MSANGHRPEAGAAPLNGHAAAAPNGHPQPRPGEQERPRTRRFIRRGGPARAQADEGGGHDQAELMLLREDNARLAQQQHQPPRVAGLLRQAGVGTAPAAMADDSGDELAQLLTDYAVMRETLLLACEEMDSSLAALRGRLAALPAALAPAEPLAASNGNGPAAVAAARVAIDGSALS